MAEQVEQEIKAEITACGDDNNIPIEDKNMSDPPQTEGFPTPAIEIHKPLFRAVISGMEPVRKKPPRKLSARSDASNRRRLALADLIGRLTDPNGGQCPHGVSPKQLLTHCLALHPDDRPGQSKNHLQVMLCRMTSKGLVSRLQTGLYTVPQFVPTQYQTEPTVVKMEGETHETESASNTSSNASMHSDELATDGVPVEPKPSPPKVTAHKLSTVLGRKRKRTPKQLSSEFVTGAQSSKPSPMILCFVCKMPGALNPQGVPEMLLACRACRRKVHPSCLGYSKPLANRCRTQWQWECRDCKPCTKCTSKTRENLLFCHLCDSAYHTDCAGMLEMDTNMSPGPRWSCPPCAEIAVSSAAADKASDKAAVAAKRRRCSAASAESAFADGVVTFGVGATFPTCDCDNTSALPDLSETTELRFAATQAEHWTVTDVAHFFRQHGFSNTEADVFVEQEIDGQALLLLKRTDVLSRLSLKLGPALKLYRRIFALQSVVARILS